MSTQIGYDDTPFIPGTPYRVHDGTRPQPPAVTPGAGACPPSDAVVLFDGTNLSAWESIRGGDAGWRVVEGCIEVVAKTGDIVTRESFGDCQIHLEWAAPADVQRESQGRGNSGVFLMNLYEIQVLDCYQNLTYADGTTGAIYGQHPPLVNACRPPGEWQTYDIVWQSPLFEGDRLTRPGRLTLLHNGVVLHHGAEVMGPTGHRSLPVQAPHPPTGPLRLQDHGDPVRFRNIWVRRL